MDDDNPYQRIPGGGWRVRHRDDGRRIDNRNDGGFGHHRRDNQTRDDRRDQGARPRENRQRGDNRTTRPMGFKAIENLMHEEDKSQIILKLTNENAGFKLRLECDDTHSPEFVSNIIHVIHKALPYRGAPTSTMKLLNDVRFSKLLSIHLNAYFVQITGVVSAMQIQRYARSAKMLLEIFDMMLLKIPQCWDKLYVVLCVMDSGFKRVRESGLLRDDEIPDKIHIQLDKCNDLRSNIHLQEPRTRRSNRDDERAPPDNFRELSVIPTANDIYTTEEVFLRKNKAEGSYKHLNHYLDVQFRLLKEDFTRPLREGITAYMRTVAEGTKERNTDIRVYESVQILYPQCTQNGVSYRIRFDVSRLKRVRWQATKRLIFGSLLCLSNDRFQTLYFATVAHRDVKLLADGELDIQFEHNLEEISNQLQAGGTFIMAETTAYFEAYRHVLEGLKHIDDELPLQKYLVLGEKDVAAPAYVRRNQDERVDLSVLCKNEGNEDSDTDSSEDDTGLSWAKLELKRRKQKQKSVKLLDINTWPSANAMHLDNTQYEALHSALTKELAIIQGPPGTGKTYIGLKIVKALLTNKNLLFGNNVEGMLRRLQLGDEVKTTPILVVCYTNHALDQFLEGIETFCDWGIIRVGGRSRSESMKKFSLRTLRQELRRKGSVPEAVFLGRKTIQSEMKRLDSKMDQVATQLAMSDNGILHENILEDHMSERHFNDLRTVFEVGGFTVQYNKQSFLMEWLGLGDNFYEEPEVNDAEANAEAQEEDEDNSDVDEDATVMEGQRKLDLDDDHNVRMRQMEHQDNVANAMKNLAFQIDLSVDKRQDSKSGNPQNDEVWQIQRSAKKKRNRKIKRQLQSTQMMSEDDVNAVRNIWGLRFDDRWKLYRYWVFQYKQRLRMSISTYEVEYQRAADRLREILNEEDKGIMNTAKILGMTTTGAAKYRNILQEVKPKIIIVEEAAEVLEAHIVTTLSEACEHLILIGDHKQLRPNPTVYELAEHYNLKVSLFERMLNNGMACVTLGQQHRMRPEISQLMRHIYPDLQDHSTVNSYEDIRGISKNLFFIDHRFPEDNNEELKSKSNFHEAKFIAALCNYLILQGYLASQITVLTAYTGQILQLKKNMPRSRFEGVRISAIDNYQGEENDIILLSLVRSNEGNTAGFVKEDNRLCVSLSRAKQGLYVIGNFKLLESSSRLWTKVAQSARDVKSFGRSLPLYCQNHPREERLSVQDARDFERAPEGGCTRPCEFRLNCGHVCERMCHSYDKDHAQYKCLKICGKILCDVEGHSCRGPCSQLCGECTILVEKTMPICEHEQMVPCSVNPRRFKCREKCSKPLFCRHQCQNICGEECTTQCRTNVDRTLPCGHTVKMKCFQDPETYACTARCDVSLDCEHKCVGTCGQCFRGRLHRPCKKNCGRILVCGHQCKVPCTKECPPCGAACQNRCVHSECKKQCGQKCTPCKEPCDWQCDHQVCTKLCSEPCNRKPCNEPCKRILHCGHQCIGLCGETCPNKCRVCHKVEVEDIFFGDEDEEGACFVQLQDCGHIFEVNGLDTWMETKVEEDQNIQLKACPKCKIAIRRNLRYGSIINQTLNDIEKVKQKVIEQSAEDRDVRQAVIIAEIDELEEFDERSAQIFESRMYDDMPFEEIQCVGLGVQIVKAVCKLKRDLNKKFQSDLKYKLGMDQVTSLAAQAYNELNKLSTWSTELRQRLSEQEVKETSAEIRRLTLFITFILTLHRVKERGIKLPIEVKINQDRCIAQLRRGKALTNEDEKTAEGVVQELAKHAPLSGLGISKKEQEEILAWGKTNGLAQGHWYKCPNGHIYAIGDCGGATEVSRCPECNVKIGGTSHQLAEGNRVASEMDGARYGAWSQQANMENYGREIRF